MTGLALGICDRALAPGGAAPEWVQLFPEGRMTGRDGRVFDLVDPAALVLAFQSSGLDLPIDYEHQNDRPEAKLSGPVPAAGWIKELKTAEGGLWGRVEWTATARELIGNREYRYLSPSFLYHPKTRAIVRLKGAGLVHNPNLPLAALASQEDAMLPEATPPKPAKPADPAALARLARMLGLAPDSDAETILAAILARIDAPADGPQPATAAELPDPLRFVPIDAVRDLLEDRNARIAAMREASVSAKVEDAFRNGHITPAMRGWATALCAQDPDSFDAFIARSPAPYAHLTRPLNLSAAYGATTAQRGNSAEEDAVCAQLGLPPGSLKT